MLRMLELMWLLEMVLMLRVMVLVGVGRGAGVRVSACAAGVRPLLPLARADLVEAQTNGQARGNRGVVVPLQRAAVPEEVDGEETRRLQDVHDAV